MECGIIYEDERPSAPGIQSRHGFLMPHQFGVFAMTHAIYRVTSFEIVGPHTLAVTFADGVKRTIDFLPVLRGEL